MKKVLIITYYWPPGSSPGVQRFLKFSKYLPENGWEPIILTVKNGSYPAYDYSLLDDIKDEIKTYRTNTLEPFTLFNMLKRKKGNSSTVGMIGLDSKTSILNKLSLFIRANLFIPDARKYWKVFAIKEAKKIIREENIDAIITTGPPHSTHLIGLAIKKKTNIPWIVDLRDPWTNIYYNKFFPRTERTKRKDLRLERTVVENADSIITVSKGLSNEFEAKSKRIKIIYNGFDNFDIPIWDEKSTEKFTLSYIGNFKPNQNIEALWKAIKELVDENKSFKNLFRLTITGNISNCVKSKIEEYSILDQVILNGFVKHKEATKLMVHSNALLFIIPNVENNELIITGKLFEYLASQTPIISIGPQKGNAYFILEDANHEKMVDYSNVEDLKKNILNAFNTWLNNNKTSTRLSTKSILKYSRKELTKELVSELELISK